MKHLLTILAALLALHLPSTSSALDLFGAVKVTNIAYFDGIGVAQFSKLPSACKNKDRWVGDFDLPDSPMWTTIHMAYHKGQNVWIGLSGSNECGLWAISTTNLKDFAARAPKPLNLEAIE